MAEIEGVYIAKTTALIEFEGRRVLIKQGISTVRDGHPIQKDHPELFVPLNVMYDVEDKTAKNAPKVETATAAPGERRTVGTARPSRRGPRKAADDA